MTPSSIALDTVRALQARATNTASSPTSRATGAARPERGHGPLHLGQEGRAGMAARMAARGLPRLAEDGRARIGPSSTSRRSTTKPRPITRRRKQNAARNPWMRSIPSCCATYEKLGIPLREREALAGRRGRCGVRQRLGRDDLQGEARRARHHLLLVRRGGARAPRSRPQISRHGRAAERQFLRRAQFGGVQRRLVRLCAAGRALPDGTVDLFPHQRGEERASSSARCSSPTRAPMSAISKAAPRRSATKTSSMPRSSS